MHMIGTIDPQNPLIVVALEQEAQHFATEHPVLITGVGKLRAGIAVSRALASGPMPSVIVNVGTAGALRDNVYGTHEIRRVFQHDYDDEQLAAITGRHDGPPLDLFHHRGSGDEGEPLVLASGDRFIQDGATRAVLALHADLVDMEGYAVAFAAERMGVAARLIKHVSDRAEEGSSETWAQNVDACARDLAQWVRDQL